MLDTIKVLLVENKEHDAQQIKQALAEAPTNMFLIRHEVNLSNAIRQIETDTPDIVLLSMNLPDSNGIDTLHRFTKDQFHLPVIVLAESEDRELGLLAIQSGAQDFLVNSSENCRNLPQIIQFALERHHTLQELQKSEERYRLISEVASDYMFAARVTPEGKLIQEWTTGALEPITGYSLNEYLENGGWQSIVHPDDQWIDDYDMEMLRQNKTIETELRIIRKDGTTAWVQVHGVPVWDEEKNQLKGIYGSTLDITRRKISETDLSLSEQQFKTVFEQAPLGIALADAQTGEYQKVNHRLAEMVGRTVEELESMRWMEITHMDDIQLDQNHLNQLNRGFFQRYQIEKRYLHSNGTSVWVNMIVTPVLVPGSAKPYVLSIVEDITEKKFNEKKLQESENRFRLLYEQAPIPYQSLNANGIVLEVNDAWLKELGYEKEEVIGKYFADFLEEQSSESFPRNFERFKKLGEVHNIHYGMLRKDQSIIQVNFDGRIAYDEQENLLQTHCVFTNVTEQKRMQDALENRLVALTRPLDDPKNISFTDLFDLDEIQKIQDEFASAAGVASIITQPDGTSITRPSNFSRLCGEVFHETEQGRLNCYQTGRQIGKFSDGKPTILPCLSKGQWDAGARISVAGHHVATWLIGQVRDETANEAGLRKYARSIGADEEEAIKAFYEMPLISSEQFSRIAQMLDALSNQLSDMAYQNIQQARFISDLQKAENEQKKNIARLESLAAILQHPYQDIQKFLDFALQEAIDLTESQFGYIFFYDEEKKELEVHAGIKHLREGKHLPPKTVYALEDVGLWGETIQQQRAVIINDYQAPNPLGNESLEELSQLTRFLAVPVFSNERIVAVIGIANKQSDYDQQDALQLTLLVNNVWRVVERREAITQLTEVSQRLRHYIETSSVMLFAYRLNAGRIDLMWLSNNAERLLGYTYNEIRDPEWWPTNLVDNNVDYLEDVQNWDSPDTDSKIQEYRFRHKDGHIIWIQENIQIAHDAAGEPIEAITSWIDVTNLKVQEQKIMRQAYVQSQLVAMGRSLGTTIDINIVYHTAYHYICKIIDIPNLCVSLLDTDVRNLKRVFAINEKVAVDVSSLPSTPYSPTKPVDHRSKVISTRNMITTTELEEGEGRWVFYATTPMKPRSAIYIPLIGEGKCIGVLELQSYKANAFSQEISELLSGVANQLALAIQNARLYEQIRKRVSQLGGLREIDTAINAHQSLEFIYQLVLNQVRFHLKSDAAAVLILDEESQKLVYQDGYGFENENVHLIQFPMEKCLPALVAQNGKTIQHLGHDQYDELLNQCPRWAQESFRSYIGIPIKIGKTVRGVLEVCHRTTFSPQSEWMQYLETLAGQVAIAIENNELISNLQQTANELMLAYDATIAGWSQAMDLRDKETEGHTQRVSELTVQVVQQLNLPAEEIIHIRRGALLHDIGKLGVPDDILHKPGPLDEREWEIMRKHPLFAYEMLKSVEYLKPALDIPRYHHEKWDGSGYPYGLKGKEIPISARVFALVDVWDALTNDRPYREAWSKEKVTEYIRSGTGTHFDPELVELFLSMVNDLSSKDEESH